MPLNHTFVLDRRDTCSDTFGVNSRNSVCVPDATLCCKCLPTHLKLASLVSRELTTFAFQASHLERISHLVSKDLDEVGVVWESKSPYHTISNTSQNMPELT